MSKPWCVVLFLFVTAAFGGEEEALVLDLDAVTEFQHAGGKDEKRLVNAMIEKYDGKRVRFSGYLYYDQKVVNRGGKKFCLELTLVNTCKAQQRASVRVYVNPGKLDARLKRSEKEQILVTVVGRAVLNKDKGVRIENARIVDVDNQGKQ